MIVKNRSQLALLVCGLLLPWIFFDADIGDAFYISTASWLYAFHPIPPEGVVPLWYGALPIWFTVFVESIWWKIVGSGAHVLWLRAFWVIVYVVTALALSRFLERFYEKKAALAAAVLAIMGLVVASDHYSITYYSLPPILLLFSFSLAACAGELNTSKARWFYFGAGIFGAAASLARIPNFAFLGLFSLLLVLLLRGPWQWRIKNLLWCWAGGIAGILAGAAILYSTGQLGFFVQGTASLFTGFAGEDHLRLGPSATILRTLGHYWRIGVGAGIAILYAIAVAYLPARATLFLSAAIFLAIGSLKYGLLLSMVIGASLVSLGFTIWKKGDSLSAGKRVAIAGAVCLLVASNFGTCVEGVQNFKYGLWLLLPMAWLELRQLDGGRSPSKKLAPHLMIGVAALFLSSRIMWPTFPFLEQPITKMTAQFRSERLRGVFSYPDKVEQIDSVVEKLRELGLQKGEEFFVYAGVSSYYPISILYFLTETVPFLHDPGIVEYPGSRWAFFRQRLGDAERAGKLPKLIVRSIEKPVTYVTGLNYFRGLKTTSGDGTVPFTWTNGEENWLAGEVDEILRRSYRPVWQNRWFVILARDPARVW